MTSLPAGAVVLDVGCGNGKYFDLRPDIFVLGSDRSQGLVEVAARRVRPTHVRPLTSLQFIAFFGNVISLKERNKEKIVFAHLRRDISFSACAFCSVQRCHHQVLHYF